MDKHSSLSCSFVSYDGKQFNTVGATSRRRKTTGGENVFFLSILAIQFNWHQLGVDEPGQGSLTEGKGSVRLTSL
jgi:hypothetical protein